MSKEIYISSTPHETRLAIVEKDELTEIYYERENEYTLAGSIYNGRVTRVLPGMQSSFVDIGLERDAFLYITDFMEEAGDSADFEGAHAGGGAEPRKTESSGGGERRGGGGSGNGDRSRGRGRSDNRSEGRSDSRSQGRDDSRGGRPAASASADEGFEVAPSAQPVASTASDETIGEGEPGADGSRRWRGRRGRRRNRGNGEARAEGAPVTGDATVEDDSEGFGARHEAIDASAGSDASAGFEGEAAASAATEPSRFEQGSESRGGRERRGGRDRGRSRESRGSSPQEGTPEENTRGNDSADHGSRQESIRERFAPRGLRSGHRPEETVDLNAAPEAEPFILPGESLSKYRRGEDATPAATAPANEIVLVPRASTESQSLTGWDGGAVLPGETLSRRSSATPSTGGRDHDRGADRGSDRNSGRGGREGGRNRRGGREDRGGERQGRADHTPVQASSVKPAHDDAALTSYSAAPTGLHPADAVQPAVTSGHEFESPIPVHESVSGFSDTHAPEPAPYEPQTDGLPEQAAEEHEAHLMEAAVEFHETVAEYEPEEASASFRVDPAGTREFRQSAPAEPHESHHEVPAQPHEEAEGQYAAPQHEFTDIHSTGEMVSEAPVAEAPVATEKLAHESHVATHGAASEASGGFAPGHGELEEEFLDDEDSDFTTVHAHAEHDDTEEETLEGAADLASMLHDLSIDQITRPESLDLEDDEEDDDFDIDEEEMEEDELDADGEEPGADEDDADSEPSEGDEDPYAEADSYDENGELIPRAVVAPEGVSGSQREGRRGEGRRDGRRGRGRNRDRGTATTTSEARPERTAERTSERNADRPAQSEGGERGSRDSRGMAGSRSRDGRSGGRSDGRRHSVQASEMPAISDLLKPGQELLVQIAKEPIAKKGARITSHIALPGRFLVFMPTVSHVGVSRKIESDGERRRLKEILLSERGDATGGFIVRTAASGASEEELRSDLRFLLNLWADIKTRSESSKSPALIYHDLNLIERILRDQVTDNFSAIWVDTEAEYERVLRFLQRFQPSLIRRVKLYSKETPLFEQFGITAEIDKALRSKVWLKSGGSIVINQTEALVAIDINTGKFVGKTTKLEDTIVKTNLDAIPEIVRQMRLRDLGGIIIIDFIDMDERKNRNRVMAALEEELKKDRAPSKMLPFNDFGLIAITRKRVKQTLERTLSTTCGVCQGTGMTKSPVTVCNDIYIEMRKMHKLSSEKGDIMLRVHPEVVKQLKLGGGKWLQDMEELSGKTILIKSDASLHPEQFDIH